MRKKNVYAREERSERLEISWKNACWSHLGITHAFFSVNYSFIVSSLINTSILLGCV